MRRIQAPGVEINEIDRSQYNVKTDDSLTDTATLIAGFADNGPDYQTLYISNIQQFIQTFGYPTSEAERYFYYGAKEVLDNRGVLYCAKLPYYNESFKKYSYTDYEIDPTVKEISTLYQIINQDLLCHNANVPQHNENNSFMTTMKLVKLQKSQARRLDLEILSNEFQYKMLDDFYDYMFDTSEDKTYKKETFNKYFRNYTGMHYIRNLLEVDPTQISTSEVVVDNNLQKNYDIIDDLSNIAINFKNFYNKTESPVDEAFDMFIKTKTLDEYRNYYLNFSNVLNISVLNRISVDQVSSYWVADCINLSNYCNDEYDVFDVLYSDLRLIDDKITSYVDIKSKDNKGNSGLMSLDQYDNYKIGKLQVPINNIRIVDISRGKYKWNDDHDKQFLGIMPVVTTAANALYYQDFIHSKTRYSDYNALNKIQTIYSEKDVMTLSDDMYYDENSREYLFAGPLSSNQYKSGTADVATSYFPTMAYTATNHIDKNYMKQIGIVVFKLLKSTSNSNKVACVPVESFVGSLKRSDTNNINNTNVFLDTIVNDNSTYINVFSNANFNEEKETEIDKASIYAIKDQTATSLGFFDSQSIKHIHVKQSIFYPLELIFKNNNNIDKINIDIVCDAGVSNIAQYIASSKMLNMTDVTNRYGFYDIVDADGRSKFLIDAEKHTAVWREVGKMYDNFCKSIRKDCMFVMDSMRQTCVVGNHKIIRKTKLTNTIVNNIVSQLNYQINLNTSYGAGYCDWFYLNDVYSGLYFWCPPSIKATGAYIYTDIYYNYWDAPAGFNRGVLRNTYDIAFNPTIDEAGKIYEKSWNYAMQYPINGIVLEGQRTFQLDKTAFDRVNVRRMFLKMEKLVYKIAKTFCYEQNTEYLRQRFVDTIKPIFEEAKNGGGISEYIIICNDKNNTSQTIDNHELHCTIAIRPIKTIEYIVLNFIAMPQSGTFTEEELLKMTPYYNK